MRHVFQHVGVSDGSTPGDVGVIVASQDLSVSPPWIVYGTEPFFLHARRHVFTLAAEQSPRRRSYIGIYQ